MVPEAGMEICWLVTRLNTVARLEGPLFMILSTLRHMRRWNRRASIGARQEGRPTLVVYLVHGLAPGVFLAGVEEPEACRE